MPSASVLVPALLVVLTLCPLAAAAGENQSQPVVEGTTAISAASLEARSATLGLRGAVVAGSSWREELLALVNQVRAQAGAPSLCLNEKLNVAAQSQSDSGVYAHTWNYIEGQQYDWNSLGQNIARGYGSVQSVFSAWFNEIPPNDGHRRNILNAKFNQMGAGWALGSNLWTQNFGLSSSEPCV